MKDRFAKLGVMAVVAVAALGASTGTAAAKRPTCVANEDLVVTVASPWLQYYDANGDGFVCVRDKNGSVRIDDTRF